MSSILDALKKSEAERQRGLPPTLNSPAAFHRSRPETPRRTRWWLPAAAVVGIAVAWSMGMFDFGGSSDAPAETVQGAAPASDATAEAVAPAPIDPVAIAGTEGPVATTSPDLAAPAISEPAPGAAPPAVVADPPAGTEMPAGTDATPPRRIGFGPHVRRPAGAAAAADPPPGDAPALTAAQVPEPVTPPLPAGDPNVAPATPTPTPTPPDATPPDATPAADPLPPPTPARADGIPTIHELPFAARRGLPEIAVTMHMYSADPARRFALVNGVRVRDGESLEGGIDVVRILPDGVQVRIEGTEFVLPVSN